jgi:hypothetical protein
VKRPKQSSAGAVSLEAVKCDGFEFPGLKRFVVRFVDFEGPLILIGEEGAGASYFRSTHFKEVEHDIDFEQFIGSTIHELHQFVRKALAKGVVLQSESASGTHALVEAAQKGLVSARHLDAIPRALGGQFLAQLRGSVESKLLHQPVRLILVGRDERAFDTEPFSALLSVSQVCRFPRLCLAEIERVMKIKWPGIDIHAKYCSEILRWTGGQPLLVKRLLGSTVSLDQLDTMQPFKHVRDNPPEELVYWRRRLARMILSNPELARLVRDYLSGAEHPIEGVVRRAPQLARSLSLAGWLTPGFDLHETAVWRFSDLHRQWALPVLREPKRFLVESTS